ncbi:MAG: regulatory protein RecX [Actinomycetaceae bacterium]|nr:regulatory protein RecX [Actinomycetaceae bacterium]
MFPEEETNERRRRHQAAERRRRRWENNRALTGEAGVAAAKEAALTILDRCDQSVSQCRSKLLERGFTDEVIDPALERLVEVGILDDERYARSLVRARYASRALVGRALKEELRRKGLDPQVIDLAMEAELPEQLDTEMVDDLVQRKLLTLQQVEEEKQTRRIVSMLLRRGYSPAQAFASLSRVREKIEEGQ